MRLSFLLCLLYCCDIYSQVGNYVYNGSFELKYDCNPPYVLNKAFGWSNIGVDSNVMAGGLHAINCFSNAPNTGVGFQYPHYGNTFARMSPYCVTPCAYYYSRSYSKNRLKATLNANKVYCVKMYVSRQNDCPYAISDLSFYFGDNSSDTIKYANGPITYLTPQIKNPSNNIITDTMNWVPITGTFVATGIEKYLVIGNFQSNAATTSSLVDTSWGNGVWAEYFVDDVSCIEIDLPAYAGPDKSIVPGDSAFIGRSADFATDAGCTWYKLPNMSTPINIISGMWVKPAVTTTYVVRQILDCSTEKWDTVLIYEDHVGLEKLKMLKENLKIYPVPASDQLELNATNKNLLEEFKFISIYNNLGLLLHEEELFFKEGKLILNTSELPEGVYSLRIKNTSNELITKRFVIAR